MGCLHCHNHFAFGYNSRVSASVQHLLLYTIKEVIQKKKKMKEKERKLPLLSFVCSRRSTGCCRN